MTSFDSESKNRGAFGYKVLTRSMSDGDGPANLGSWLPPSQMRLMGSVGLVPGCRRWWLRLSSGYIGFLFLLPCLELSIIIDLKSNAELSYGLGCCAPHGMNGKALGMYLVASCTSEHLDFEVRHGDFLDETDRLYATYTFSILSSIDAPVGSMGSLSPAARTLAFAGS